MLEQEISKNSSVALTKRMRYLFISYMVCIILLVKAWTYKPYTCIQVGL